MSIKLKISLIVFSILLVIIMIRLIKQDKIPLKYSLPWFFVALVFFVVGVFPAPIIYLQNLLGFEILSNMLLFILVGLLLIVTLFLTMIISVQRKQINMLVQEISMKKKGK